MEKRAILAAVLMAGLLILYQTLFAPSSPPPAPVQAPVESKPAPPPSPPVAVPRRVEPPRAIPQRTVVVEAPLFRAAIGSDGGKLQEWTLHYRGDKPMVLPGALGPAGLVVQRPGAGSERVTFDVKEQPLALGPARPRGELLLAGQDAFGLKVTEAFQFHAEGFHVDLALRAENRQAIPQAVELLLPWSTLKKWPDDQKEQFQGQRPTRVVRLSRGEVHRDELAKVADLSEQGTWIGFESEWYIAALVPLTPDFKLTTSAEADGTVQIALRATPPPLAPGQAWEGRALLYVGPKEHDRLKALGVGLEQAIHFGHLLWILPMEWIAVPILWLMNFLYRQVPNYGIAIIVLTVITRILFYPLTLKSMASMKGMQALQPQINALRAKHQKDPQRLQRETMELYRKHKVNPMGGCLPMVVQIPIFYALYVVFSLAVELQNAVFLCFGTIFHTALWICDLAEQDPTYILPILMGISMFVQQKMTPTVGDPRQAKIMLIMPVVFTYMFLYLPAGLVLYWFVSNVLQILQQYYTNRRGRAAKAAG